MVNHGKIECILRKMFLIWAYQEPFTNNSYFTLKYYENFLYYIIWVVYCTNNQNIIRYFMK